jgi:hypothetical protein
MGVLRGAAFYPRRAGRRTCRALLRGAPPAPREAPSEARSRRSNAHSTSIATARLDLDREARSRPRGSISTLDPRPSTAGAGIVARVAGSWPHDLDPEARFTFTSLVAVFVPSPAVWERVPPKGAGEGEPASQAGFRSAMDTDRLWTPQCRPGRLLHRLLALHVQELRPGRLLHRLLAPHAPQRRRPHEPG